MSFGDNTYSCNGLSGIDLINGACILDSGLSISDLEAGIYSTTVVDANGCETSVEFTISEPDILSAFASVTDVSCNGESNGLAELTISGGTAPYTTEDLDGLSAGSYSTVIVDSNGCTSEVSFNVTEPEQLEVSVSVIDVSCFGEKWWFC